jgi:hypothetical protein
MPQNARSQPAVQVAVAVSEETGVTTQDTHPLLLSLCSVSLLVHASSLNQSSRSSASSSFDAPENSSTVYTHAAAAV